QSAGESPPHRYPPAQPQSSQTQPGWSETGSSGCLMIFPCLLSQYAIPLSIALSITADMLLSMDQKEKVRENRLRRMAARQGLKLSRTRRLDSLAIDYGTYHLVPAKGKALGPLTIDEVEERLTSP